MSPFEISQLSPWSHRSETRPSFLETLAPRKHQAQERTASAQGEESIHQCLPSDTQKVTRVLVKKKPPFLTPSPNLSGEAQGGALSKYPH